MKGACLGVNWALSQGYQNGRLAIGAQQNSNTQPAAGAAEKADRGGLSGLRWLAYSLLLALSLFGVFYAAFPLLVSYGGTLAADRLGLQVLEIRTGRPRLRGMRVDRLEVSGESYRLLGHDGWLTYRFAGLLDGRFEALSFSSVF